MLAIIKATEAWRHYLDATPYAFEIHTDHNNLLYFTKSQNLSKRQAHCHTPNTFGTVNMECTVDSRLSWSKQ